MYSSKTHIEDLQAETIYSSKTHIHEIKILIMSCYNELYILSSNKLECW